MGCWANRNTTDMPVLKRLAPLAAANQSLKRVQERLRVKRAELRTLQTRVGDLHKQVNSMAGAHAAKDPGQQIRNTLDAQMAALAAVARLDELAVSMQRDALTNTPNRTLMQRYLHNALVLAQRNASGAAVIFLDVDRFKEINDTLGHACGDRVLQMVARRVQAAVRDTDAVGRRGGDEFLVVLAEVSRQTDVAQIAQQIIAQVAEPFWVDDQLVRVSVSAGISLYGVDGREPHELIEKADAAMYRSKRRGGGCFSFHVHPQ